MPRPKSELTKNGKAIGIRLSESMYHEWKRLGATKWLRQQLTESKNKSAKDVQKPEAS